LPFPGAALPQPEKDYPQKNENSLNLCANIKIGFKNSNCVALGIIANHFFRTTQHFNNVVFNPKSPVAYHLYTV